MKKLLTILFCISLLSFTACEDPNEDIFEKQDEAQIDKNQKGSDFMQTTD